LGAWLWVSCSRGGIFRFGDFASFGQFSGVVLVIVPAPTNLLVARLLLFFLPKTFDLPPPCLFALSERSKQVSTTARRQTVGKASLELSAFVGFSWFPNTHSGFLKNSKGH